MGHTKVRCPNPLAPEDDGGLGGNNDAGDVGAGGDGGAAWSGAGDGNPGDTWGTSKVDVNAAW